MAATPELQGKLSEFGMGTDGAPGTEVDITDYILEFEFNKTAESVVVRPWGSSSFPKKLQGSREAPLTLTIMDDEEGAMEEHFGDLWDSGKAVNYEYFAKGNATGKRVVTGTLRVIEMTEPQSGEGSEVQQFQVTLEPQELPVRGTVA